MSGTVRLHRFGLVPYNDAWDWQRAAAAAIREGAPEALAVLQHPHVYTFGRRVHAENLLAPLPDAEVIESDRGGDVTYHGPGQVVAYPILNLHRRNLGAADYVRCLEEVMIRTAAAFGVHAGRVPGRPGVWVGDAKLGAVGVRVQRAVSTHGLALNVAPDLTRFEAINPCGLSGIEVTSLERELSHTPAFDAAEEALLDAFESVFDSKLQESDDAGRGSGGAAHARRVWGVSPQVPLVEGRSRQGLRPQDAQSRTAVSLGR
jgi:lipoyl(octanoyl) transferase